MSGAELPPPPPGSTPGRPSQAPLRPESPPGPTPPPPPDHLRAPSGYVGYSAGQGMREQLRPIRTVSTWAMILAAVTGVASLISAIVSANVAGEAQAFLDGEITEDAFLDANDLAPLAQISSTAPMIAAAVLGMIWMFRMSKNARALGRATTFAPVLAVVGWFMPPLLYVIPLLVLRELWQASDPDTPPGEDGWRRSGENPVLYVWFAVYVVIPAVLFVVSFGSVLDATLNLDTDTESIAEAAAATSATVLVVGGILTLVGAGAWVVVVKRLTERHVELTGER